MWIRIDIIQAVALKLLDYFDFKDILELQRRRKRGFRVLFSFAFPISGLLHQALGLAELYIEEKE